MAPRSSARRNTTRVPSGPRLMALQWGHARPRVETVPTDAVNLRKQLLQWGHARPRVETRGQWSGIRGQHWLQWGHARPRVETPAESVPQCEINGFNGATRVHTRKSLARHRHSLELEGSKRPRASTRGND